MALILTADANPGTASWSSADVSHAIVASGTVTIGLGTSSQTAVLDASLSGLPVLLSFQGSAPDATLFAVAASWSGGTLTVTGNANATAATDVAYAVVAPL